MTATVNHHPENHQPVTRTMELARGASGAQADAHLHEGNTKLVPWLMLTAILSGIAAGVSIVSLVMVVIQMAQSESRMRAELDKQNRFIQEFRIRVEDAEIAAEEVNPRFHPRRTE